MKKKILSLILILILILLAIIGILFFFSTESRVKRYVNQEYGINANIVRKEDKNNGNILYIIHNESNNTNFTCGIYKEDFELDNTKFFSYKSIKCDYYKMLTKSLENKISSIEEKYNITFERGNSGLIDKVIINNNNIENEMANVTKAVNELMKLYDLKKSVKEEIYIVSNNKVSNYFYLYTINGESTKMHDSSKDFYKQNEINKEMIEQVIDYINKRYFVESTLYETSVALPIINTNPTRYENAIFTLIDSGNNFKIEVTVNKEKYNKDKKNNAISEIENYVINEMKYSS